MTEVRNAYYFWRRINALYEFTKDHPRDPKTRKGGLGWSKVPKILLFSIKSETVVHLLEPLILPAGVPWKIVAIHEFMITLAANEK